MSQPTIIIIEDNAPDRMILTMILEDLVDPETYHLFESDADLQDYLRTIDGRTPHIFIADMQLIGTEGVAILQTIRQTYPDLPTYLVVMSGSSLNEPSEATWLDYFFEKPMEMSALREELAKIIQAARQKWAQG